MRQFRDDLQSLPAHATKRHGKMKLPDLIAACRGLPGERLSPATVNSHLNALHRLLQFAVVEEWLPTNPARGLQLEDPVHDEDKRHPFTATHLKAIFSAPLYTGCLNDGPGYDKPGESKPRRGRFWVPLIGLFGGLRLNEICQLTEDDIQEIAGHHVFRMTDEGVKALKTPAARRKVPVHPELERLGFLVYVNSIRTDHAPRSRLFPDLSVAKTGYASDNMSKWFARFLDKRGISDRELGFHSFRHAFKDRMDAAGIDTERKQLIGGWARRGTDRVYGNAEDVRVPLLAVEVRKISYPGCPSSEVLGQWGFGFSGGLGSSGVDI